MLKTKIQTKNINNKFIDINYKSYFIDLDIIHICEYIYKKELQKENTIKKTFSYKLQLLKELKYKLNIKKAYYINNLRAILKDLNENNIISLYHEKILKFNGLSHINDKLINLKIIKKPIGLLLAYHFYIKQKDKNNFKFLISINNDIKILEEKIKYFSSYYDTIINTEKKINSYDLYSLKQNKITNNIKTLIYYYLIKIKKTKTKKLKYNINLKAKLNLNIVDLKDIENLINKNINLSYKKTINEIKPINLDFLNKILNKYD